MNERDRLEAEVALLRLQHAALLWDLPIIGNGDVPPALGLTISAWQLLKLAGEAPPGIHVGRRIYYRTADLRTWIQNLQAKKNAGEEAGVEVGQECL